MFVMNTLVLGTTHFNRTSHLQDYKPHRLETLHIGHLDVSSGPAPAADNIINMVIFIKQMNTFEKM